MMQPSKASDGASSHAKHWAFVAVCVAVLALGCGPKTAETPVPEPEPDRAATPAAAAAPHDPSTFRLAISGEPRTLDPGLATDTQSVQIILNTFEGLMSYDKEAGPIRYGVAESYSISDDGRVYTFKLRKGVTWSNGDPLTASDFAYAWRRVLYPSTASEYAWLLTDAARIKGAAAFNTGRDSGESLGIEAINDRTLVVTLEEPVPYFLDLTAFATFMPIPAKADQAGVPWKGTSTWISNGPYVLSEDSSARNYLLEKNPTYWGQADVAMDRVEVRVIESDDARIAAFDTNDLDWTGPQELPLAQIQTLAARREFRQDTYLAVEYLVFNTLIPPLDDPRVRNAIALAIDRDDIVIRLLGGVGQAAYGFVPPIPGYSTKVHRTSDSDRARTLLADAGYANGEGFPKLRYLYPSSNSNAKAVGELVRQQLMGALGIELELEGQPLAQLLDTMQSRDFQVARSAWVGDIVDPVSFLGLWTTESQQNKAGWHNETYDSLMRAALAAPDRAARYAIYAEAEHMLDTELPVAPLYYKHQTYLLKPEIEGFAAHKLNIHLIKYVRRRATP